MRDAVVFVIGAGVSHVIIVGGGMRSTDRVVFDSGVRGRVGHDAVIAGGGTRYCNRRNEM